MREFEVFIVVTFIPFYSVDEELWKQWTMFVINKTGSARKLSEELENALKEYMKK